MTLKNYLLLNKILYNTLDLYHNSTFKHKTVEFCFNINDFHQTPLYQTTNAVRTSP